MVGSLQASADSQIPSGDSDWHFRVSVKGKPRLMPWGQMLLGCSNVACELCLAFAAAPQSISDSRASEDTALWGAGWRFPSTPERLVLPASTGLHRHVGVHLQDHVPVLIQEEDPKGVHLVRNAAGLWDTWDNAHCPDNALDGGVIGRADDLQGRKGAWLPGALPSPTHCAIYTFLTQASEKVST